MTDKFKILVADDEESLRGIVKEVLTDSGYDVETATNGREALEMVKKNNIYDVVITDIRMPELNGIELLEAIKKFNPNIQVVIMTSHGSLDTAIKAIRLGAYDYLTKPFEDLDMITTVINRTVEKLRLELEVKRLVEELKRRNEDVSSLYECNSQMSATLESDAILTQATGHMAKLGRSKSVLYFACDSETLTLNGRKATGFSGKVEDLHYEMKGGKLAQHSFAAIDSDVELKKKMALTPEPAHTLLLPVSVENRGLGVFALAHEGDWTFDDRALVIQFSGNVATHLERAELHQQVADLAIRDGLTGLFNHRYFQNTLRSEIERAQRFKNKLSLLLLDVDQFKKFNDTNGHPAGDILLRETGRLIRDALRKIDVAARYGGEEFVIILTETEKEGAQIVAERLRAMIQDFPYPKRESQPMGFVSVSIGLAEYPTNADSKEALVEAADKALYKAKEEGRNRVCVSREESKPKKK